MLIDQAIKDLQTAINQSSQMVSDYVYIGGDTINSERLPAVLISADLYEENRDITTAYGTKKSYNILIDIMASAETSHNTLLTLSLLRVEIENILSSVTFTDSSIYEFIQTGCGPIESQEGTSKTGRLQMIYTLRS